MNCFCSEMFTKASRHTGLCSPRKCKITAFVAIGRRVSVICAESLFRFLAQFGRITTSRAGIRRRAASITPDVAFSIKGFSSIELSQGGDTSMSYRPSLHFRMVAALLPMIFTSTSHATWSIVIADTETKEVAVGTVTCLEDFDLLAIVPVIVVGTGAAAVQSAGDFDGIRRPIIFDNFIAGIPPENIFAIVSAVEGHEQRQYGIVDTKGGSVNFSGNLNSQWAGGVTGTVGSMVYAIQGNILSGDCVVPAIEQAILTTVGDIPQKLMAGMQAAGANGGDGRCSCSNANPMGCGCPPSKFTKPGHIGGMVVARIGDADDPLCNRFGCVDGDYFMRLNVPFQDPGNPDPVLQLQDQFDSWRASLDGRPDAIQSTVEFDPPGPLAEGASTSMQITLRDYQGLPIAVSIQSVTVVHAPGSDGISTIGSVVDLGNGSFSVVITAGTTMGTDRFRVSVDDGTRPAILAPDPASELLGPMPTDDCALAPAAAEGTFPFNSLGATTDGPDEPLVCDFSGDTQVASDVWLCYTSSLTSGIHAVTASLCNSDYNTKLAVYEGCTCPTEASAVACNDDNCGGMLQSEVEFTATAGQDYLVRIGGFGGDQGIGTLTITGHFGACCLPDGTCQQLSFDACSGAGGQVREEGSTCETASCPPPPPQAEQILNADAKLAPSTKNRVLSIATGAPGELQAIQVTFVDLPPPFHTWNGTTMWAGPPSEVSENGGVIEPFPGSPNFHASMLTCDAPTFADWGALGVVHLIHEGIVPGGIYSVRLISVFASIMDDDFSSSLSMTTAKWGDTIEDFTTEPPGPPEGTVNIVDVLAVIARFVSVDGAIIKARADLDPGCLDFLVNIIDVLQAIGAFQGLPYPFERTVGDPCASTCISPLP